MVPLSSPPTSSHMHIADPPPNGTPTQATYNICHTALLALGLAVCTTSQRHPLPLPPLAFPTALALAPRQGRRRLPAARRCEHSPSCPAPSHTSAPARCFLYLPAA